MCRALILMPLLWMCCTVLVLWNHTLVMKIVYSVCQKWRPAALYSLCSCCVPVSIISIMTLPLTVQPWNRSLFPGWGKRVFSSPKFPGQLLGLHSLLISVYNASSTGVKWPGCEADHSPLSTAEIKNEWSQPSFCDVPLWCSQRQFCHIPASALQLLVALL
jgi:hypothetical protein